MKPQLHLLHLEDDPEDAALIKSILRADGLSCTITRVQDREGFVTALQQGGIDLILSDYSLVEFDGLSAAEIARSTWPDIPFIMVSGTLGEELAVKSLRDGAAADYILKGSLARLAPAVRRAMKEVEVRVAQRLVEERFRESERRLRTVFSELPLGIALVGVDGRPVLTNPALEKMLGYTGEDLCRMSFVDYTHPDDRAKDLELYEQLVLGTRTGYQIEKRYLRKDGQTVWGRLSVCLAREKTGHANFAIRMVEDMTERRRLEAQFIEAQKMEVIGQLAGGVAHDFNNILAATLMHLSLLQDNPHLTLDTKESLREVEKETMRAANLTRQLLLFSRKQAAQTRPLEMNALLDGMLKMVRRLLGENIEIISQVSSHAMWVNADEGMMEQVVMNLCINARDAMAKGGKLTLATKVVEIQAQPANPNPDVRPGSFVCLSVTDTGLGMDEIVLRRIFEPFFTTKEVGKGTGLGLATVFGIVKLHNGWIEVESTVGQGSSFRIYIPAAKQLGSFAASRNAEEIKGGSETILVVEDEAFVRRLLVLCLRKLGYAVLEAGNGLEALKIWEQHHEKIALLFTDTLMPGNVTGLDLAVRLKKEKGSLKIISSSGYSATPVDFPLAAGEIRYLPKPYALADLGRTVRDCLDNP